MTKIEKCHFIGIGGIGMSGLARILLQRQRAVSGSDLASTSVTENLSRMGATVFEGHLEEQLPSEATVIVSTDIKPENAEYQAALKLKLPVLHRSDLLALLMEGQKPLAVTGTHGKTTTSALLAWVLVQAGMDPSFAIGGWLPGLDTNATAGQGEYFVAEADESDGSFSKYRPFGAIITNIDHDHMNHFGTETKLINAFGKFAKHVTKHLFWCGDDALCKRLAPNGTSYGFNVSNDLRVENYRQQGWVSTFDVIWQGKEFRDIELALPGRHNVLNALGVFGLVVSLGVSEEAIRQAFKTFSGVKRRCELKSDRRGILILDDYAHHPAELAATLTAIRGAVEERRIIAVFQPHRYSRTKHCMGQYKHVFDEADEVLVTDIYAAGEEALPKVSAQAIIKELEEHSQAPVRYVPRNSLRSTLVAIARPHDVIVTLGAGDVTKLGGELAEHFADQSPKRLTVGVVCGGMSVEHDVSILSTRQILPHLKAECYEIKLFGISKEGKWVFGDDALDKLAVLSKTPSETQRSQPLSAEILTQLMACDIIFPVVHGRNGEDGTLQGFFEVLGKAYVGCDHRASAVCMDKALTKQVAAAAGVPVAPFVAISNWEWNHRRENILSAIEEQLTWPLYVKPSHLGSSVGIRKVTTSEELHSAIAAALKVDTDVLIDSEMIMREIEFGILGNEQVTVMHPGEIFSAGNLHTYEGKYIDGKTTPDTTYAELPPDVLQEGMALAAKAYKAAGCTGLARADFFLDRDNKFWLSEINPMPGLTKNSMFPRLCVESKMALPDVMHKLIILALARRRSLQRLAV
ncbi:MAG: UDP-N-acetylmuramate--L-alanine ligase [Chlamydiales bacterium]|nr:UDP-N-acetylmuramate--L-alanine ligase [Chlamydiales bacterium]